MSADYEIIGGLALLPIAAAILPVVGAGYAIYKGVQFAERQSETRRRRQEEERRMQEQIHQRQNESYYASMVEMYDSYKAISHKYDLEIDHIEKEMTEALSKLHVGFPDDLRSAGDLHNFESAIKRKEASLIRKFREQREGIVDEFEQELKGTFEQISSKISKTEQGIGFLKNINNINEHERAYVKDTINKAMASVELLRVEANDVPEILFGELNDAIRYYNGNELEIAYGKASGVVLSCLQKIEDIQKRKAEHYSFIDEISRKIMSIETRIIECRRIHFRWEGEVIEEDLFRFESVLFGGITDRLSLIKEKIERYSNYQGDYLIEIKSILDECEALDLDVISVCKYAAVKMVFAYSENDNAEIITNILEEQGFRLIDSAYESDSEGNPLHINYINEMTDEKITVVLDPTDAGVQISVHNYGNDMSDDGNTKTQLAVQNALNSALNDEGVCHKLGGVSSLTDESDLVAVRNKGMQHSTAADQYARKI